MTRQLLIFTDLDGSLLDLETYSYDAARPALREVRARGVPLIFCSSKTRAEQEFFRAEIGVCDPFIVENGAAIFIPKTYFPFAYEAQREDGDYNVIELGAGVELIRQHLEQVRKDLRLSFRGYAELSLAELCAATNLDAAAALRAQQREYSETIIGAMSPRETDVLQRTLQQVGLSCLRGSRFYTVTSLSADKGKAVRMLTALFHRHFGFILTAGIGDGLNDAPMLQCVDMPFLLRKAGGGWANVEAANLCKVDDGGARGWNAVVCRLLRDGG